jgi:TPP-dependent pyruvate/acetoin dehydrogenase alpha subunit
MKVVGAKLDEARRKEIEASIEAEIKDAFEFAETTPFPPVSELLTDVYRN